MAQHRLTSQRRTLLLPVGAIAAAAVATMWVPVPAHASSSGVPRGCASKGSASTLAGSTATAEALGAQVAFNVIPGPLPLTGNLVEDDLSFARSLVSGGPQMSVQAAPWYPGDIAANLGSLLSADGVEGVPNDPAQAFASYPPSPSEPADSTFPEQQPVPANSPLRPNVATAEAHAATTRATAVSTLASLAVGPRVHPLVGVGRIQSTNDVVPGTNCMTARAASTIGAIDIAGMVHISSLTSNALAQTDGRTAKPAGGVNVGSVTVRGMAAQVDDKGIHVLGHSAPTLGLSAQQVQNLLNETLGQDGITVRLVGPTTSTTGGASQADSGALVITFKHAIDVPYIPGEPNIPVPGLGNQSLPSGVYDAVTTLTLGSSVVSANGAAVPVFSLGSPVSGGPPVASSPLQAQAPAANVGAGMAAPTGSSPLLPSVAGPARAVLRAFIPGRSIPVGWLVMGLMVCGFVSYQLLLAAWAQLLKGRG